MNTEEKLLKLKKLADAMYYAAFNLTTDASLLRKTMEDYHQFIIHEWHKEEPVSKDLEEAAESYAKYERSDGGGGIDVTRLDAFIEGAQWQKGKDEYITEDLGEYIGKLSKQFPDVSFAKLSRIAVRVAKWHREQMMAKAIDGEVGYWNQRGLSVLIELPRELEEDDKCKVIIIKED